MFPVDVAEVIGIVQESYELLDGILEFHLNRLVFHEIACMLSDRNMVLFPVLFALGYNRMGVHQGKSTYDGNNKNDNTESDHNDTSFRIHYPLEGYAHSTF